MIPSEEVRVEELKRTLQLLVNAAKETPHLLSFSIPIGEVGDYEDSVAFGAFRCFSCQKIRAFVFEDATGPSGVQWDLGQDTEEDRCFSECCIQFLGISLKWARGALT